MKKIVAAAVGLLGVLLFVILADTEKADAFWPLPPKPVAKNVIRQHEIREDFWEKCDYAVWKEHHQKAEKINESNFAEFCEMHQLALDGKIKEANEIRKELELRPVRKVYPKHPLRPLHSLHPRWR